jgi:hypothetical protein
VMKRSRCNAHVDLAYTIKVLAGWRLARHT